jgi:hypothetical protein
VTEFDGSDLVQTLDFVNGGFLPGAIDILLSPTFVPLPDADQDDSQEFFRFAAVVPVPAPAPALRS